MTPRVGAIVDTVAVLAGIGLVGALLVTLLSGCGASAVQHHASAATILTVATRGAGEVAVASVEAAAQGCGDEACLADVEQVSGAVGVAHEALRVATIAYREAVEVAAVADAGEDVLAALVVALARVVRQWDAVVAALARIAVDLPPLPAIVRGLLAALGGE